MVQHQDPVGGFASGPRVLQAEESAVAILTIHMRNCLKKFPLEICTFLICFIQDLMNYHGSSCWNRKSWGKDAIFVLADKILRSSCVLLAPIQAYF